MTSKMEAAMGVDDETNITEITIQPDGRIYVFGLSRQVLQMLHDLQPGEPRLLRLLRQVQKVEAAAASSRRSPP